DESAFQTSKEKLDAAADPKREIDFTCPSTEGEVNPAVVTSRQKTTGTVELPPDVVRAKPEPLQKLGKPSEIPNDLGPPVPFKESLQVKLPSIQVRAKPEWAELMDETTAELQRKIESNEIKSAEGALEVMGLKVFDISKKSKRKDIYEDQTAGQFRAP